MTPAIGFDLSTLSQADKLEVLKQLLGTVDSKTLTEVRKEVRETTSKVAKAESDEMVANFEKFRVDLVARLKGTIESWITDTGQTNSKFAMSKIEIREGKIVGEVEVKAGKGGVLTISGTAAPAGTHSLEGKVGDISVLEYNGIKYDNWTKLRDALSIPMPERESATRTLVKVAGAKAGQVSGGQPITQEMIDRTRAVKVTAAKTGETTLGELVDDLKAAAKSNGNGTADSAATVPPTPSA